MAANPHLRPRGHWDRPHTHDTPCSECKEMIIEDLGILGAKINELEIQIKIEKTRRENITEKEIIKSLTKLIDGDINDIAYRKSLIKLLVNKIFLYDDKFTITINTGNDEVKITRELLENIEKALNGEICISNNLGRQKSSHN